MSNVRKLENVRFEDLDPERQHKLLVIAEARGMSPDSLLQSYARQAQGCCNQIEAKSGPCESVQ